MDALRSMSEEERGLAEAEAVARLARHGPNLLPEAGAPGIVAVFLRQFLSPLIYILLAAALVSVMLSDLSDALFIGIVLLMNGIIGTVQEYSAGRAAAALRSLEQPHAAVMRDGIRRDIRARDLVPGDLVLLESGARVPADLRLVDADGLLCDESLLTGESVPVAKSVPAAGDAAGEPRRSLLLAGSMVTRGRGRGIVTATGRQTEIGRIAEVISGRSLSRPPLLIRLERFSRSIAVTVGVSIGLLVAAGLARGAGLQDLFMMAVGLAVSAIPEGLPVAISVALAIGMRRMAGANVIVRNMPAIESLGSCTMIATDKTGTLTMNELTVTEICLPDGALLQLEAGHDLDTCGLNSPDLGSDRSRQRAAALLKAAVLPNEAALLRSQEGWKGSGDTVDVALLAAARKGGIDHDDLRAGHPPVAAIPYEPELKYAASFHEGDTEEGGGPIRVFVKGAPETLIAMAGRMDCDGRAVPIDADALLAQKEQLTSQGLRVLAFACGEIAAEPDGVYGHRHLVDLVFLGLAGMKDPIRPEVPEAIAKCRRAGIELAMITGDDPRTAAAIAAEAGIEFRGDQVVTGEAIRQAEKEGPSALDALTREARIYARVEPAQKLAIVLSLARNGHFVAMTGDGINDAPALKNAHVGVAMGRKGTDVAKESADIIVTDDNFASIVAGIREGRVAYANIRKVILMLVSTGAAEVALFLLAIPLGLPMPLLPVQLLWLNLVTNGIQDVTLVAEKAEGDEFARPPRDPKEPIFDRLMIRRVLLSTLVMAFGGFAVFYWLLSSGYPEDAARNLLLLLFVLFENVQTFNCRSERRSVFRLSLLANPALFAAVLAAQGLHILCMYLPGISGMLHLSPVSVGEWALLLALASTLMAVMEIDKWWSSRRRGD